MKNIILLCLFPFLISLGCKNASKQPGISDQDSSHQGHNYTAPATAFVPTCDNPDISTTGIATDTSYYYTKMDKRDELGKHGCVPKNYLVLNSNSAFCDFRVMDGSNSYYYIPFKTAFVHKQGYPTKTYSPAYYRSTASEINVLNKLVTDNNLGATTYGIGICTLNSFALKLDGSGRYYFDDQAIVYNNVVYPSGKQCL